MHPSRFSFGLREAILLALAATLIAVVVAVSKL